MFFHLFGGNQLSESMAPCKLGLYEQILWKIIEIWTFSLKKMHLKYGLKVYVILSSPQCVKTDEIQMYTMYKSGN